MKQLSCNVCFKKFDRVGKLEAHKKIHTEEDVNYCNFCGKRFKRKDFFANHQEKCTTTMENTADGFSDPETQHDDLPTFISFCEGTIYNITDSDVDSTFVPDSSSDEVHITHKVPYLSNEVGRNHERMEEINDAREVPSVDNAIGGSDKIHEVPSISNEDGIHEEREKLNDICEAPNPSSDEDSETETDFYSELCDGVFKDLVAHKSDNEYLFVTLYKYFGMRLLDDDLRSWLKKSLGIRKGRFDKRLFSWLRPRTQLENRGRHCTKAIDF